MCLYKISIKFVDQFKSYGHSKRLGVSWWDPGVINLVVWRRTKGLQIFKNKFQKTTIKNPFSKPFAAKIRFLILRKINKEIYSNYKYTNHVCIIRWGTRWEKRALNKRRLCLWMEKLKSKIWKNLMYKNGYHLIIKF